MKQAFSLIELLIVVLIIGIVYTLAVSNFESLKKDKINPSLLNLKSYLFSLPHANSVELICLDRCKNCNVYIDAKVNEEFSNQFDDFLDSTVKTYRFDFNFGITDVKKDIFFNSQNNDEEICFSYEINKGVGEQVLVEYDGYIYDFTQYFTGTTRYNSLDEVMIFKEKQIQEVLR